MRELKFEIFNNILDILNSKIEILKKERSKIIESRNNDTKSSAGDKFETGREMIQIELDKNDNQLIRTSNLRKELLQIELDKEFSSVQFGSLVITNTENYFISVAMGKIIIENKLFYSISLASPLGKALYNKKANDKIQFNNKEFIIKSIY